jgi:hypothetical protein
MTKNALSTLLLLCGIGALAYGTLAFVAIQNSEHASALHEIEMLICGLAFTVAVGCGLIAAGQEKR